MGKIMELDQDLLEIYFEKKQVLLIYSSNYQKNAYLCIGFKEKHFIPKSENKEHIH